MQTRLGADVSGWLQKPKSFFIGGHTVPASKGLRTLDSINPCNQNVMAQIPVADGAVVDQAVRSARECFELGHWTRMSARDRARKMRDIGAATREAVIELATIEALDNGKLYLEALHDDLPDCADIFDYYAGWTDKHYGETCPVQDGFTNFTVKEPLGVCGLIVPWNFPLLLAMWKIAPALACGNSVVVKPSEQTSLSLIRWFEIVHEKVDLPPGLLNLVLGDGETGALISQHQGIDKVSFTGSTQVGRQIVHGSADSNLKSLSLELGGKSPNILFGDTPELDKAIDRSFHLIFSQKGEKCSEPTRFIIHESIHDYVVSELVRRAEASVCGDSFRHGVHQGAQNNQRQFKKILDYIEIGKQEGATLRAGGQACTQGENAKGFFVRPTIFTDVKSNMRIWNEEIFGPVLAITKFKTDEEAVRLANETPYGLAAGLWTSDITRAHRVSRQLNAGMIFINRYGCYDFSSPFGGFKQSGWGKEMGLHSLEAYTKTKSIWIAH